MSTINDATATIQAALDKASATAAPYTLPEGAHHLISTGLGYKSNAQITLLGDLYNDHGPSVGTLYCLTNRTPGRLKNVTIIGAGGGFVGGTSSPAGSTRKGLGIVATDGFTVKGVRTNGPLTGFGMEIKNSTAGQLQSLILLSGVKRAGADGLHFFGACTKIVGSKIAICSGDDAISFTCENEESRNAVMEQITLATLTLNSAAFSCIKFYTGIATGKATIRNVYMSGIKGRITQGPTGCPLMMQNNGIKQGCTISDITITDADLDFGAATEDGPTAFLTDCNAITLRNITLRGRRNGQFLRAVRCRGLLVTGEVWETIAGNSITDMVQLEQCGNYTINLAVRSKTGALLGHIVASNRGVDTSTRYIGFAPS